MAAPLPERAAVVGAGTMGVGIALVLAAAGCRVALCARREASLEAARPRLGALAEQVDFTTSAAEALAGAGLVIETIAEDAEAKRRLLAEAERHVAPDTILTTNTSSLRLADLAGVLERPQRFAGFHWLNPPELVELVEVIGADGTAPGTLETLVGWAEALGKAPVVIRRDVPGFAVNRLQYAILREAYALVDSGVCTIEDVDRVLTHGLGARWTAVGPFQTMDLAGLDVHAAVAANLLPELANDTKPSPTLRALVERGALGCKDGDGLRGRYAPGDVERLVAGRNRMLRGIAALRAE